MEDGSSMPLWGVFVLVFQPQQKYQNKYAPEGHTTAVFHYAYPSPL